jgi:long-chain fatty acid transport protein
LFSPNREFTVTGNPSGAPGTFPLAPGTTESDKNLFPIPSLGGNWMLNDQSSIGLAIYGNGGMNTEYPAAIFGGANPTGVNLAQMFINTSYSRMLGENHAFGVSAIMAVQFFEATGLENFGGFSTDGTKITGTGKDSGTGFGFKVGYQGELAEGFRIGASYQSKISMSEFSDYAGLFAEKGAFDIPATWTAGLSYQVSEDFVAAVDVQQILYSDVPSIANPVANLFLPDGSGALGGDNGAGFGWRDMTVLKIGGEYSGMESTTLRAGMSFTLDDQPIPDSEMMFNILAPGVMKTHFTLGASQAMGENELSIAMMYAPSNDISGANPFEAPGQQTIELKMSQWEFEVGFSF